MSRVDIQHNFSPYFYILRTTQDTQLGNMINRLAFVPQLAAVVFFGARYYRRLPVALFLQTFTFVALNKVCTSQVRDTYLLIMFSPYVGRKIVVEGNALYKYNSKRPFYNCHTKVFFCNTGCLNCNLSTVGILQKFN